MGLRLNFAAILAVSGLMLSSASADDADSDKAKVQGTWKATSAISDGKKVEEPTLGEFIFSGDTFVNGEVQRAPENCPACAMGLTAEFVFKRLDVNEDKLVTVTEFRRSPGMDDEAKSREVVGRLDKNGDGKLSWEELNTAFEARHANCKKPDPATLAANAEQVRPDGRGDGNRFAQVFILRSDQNGDGKRE